MVSSKRLLPPERTLIHVKRLRTFAASAGLIAAAAMTIGTGTGMASAETTADSSKFEHSSTLTDGKLAIKVTNKAPWDANCTFAIYEARALPVLIDFADASNDAINGTGSYDALSAAGAKVRAETILNDRLDTGFFPSGQSRTATWNSGRSNTEYAVSMSCATYSQTGNEVFGYTAFKVTGTGSNAGGSGSLGNVGLGSLMP